MSQLSDRLARDLREIAAGADPSPAAWDSIVSRLANDEHTSEVLVLAPTPTKPRRPVRLAVAAASVVVIAGSVAMLAARDADVDDTSPIANTSPPTATTPTATVPTATAPTTVPGTTRVTPLSGWWPQANLDEVRQAQQAADAGDPDYTWQVDPGLAALGPSDPVEAEIFARFLRQGLGWEQFAYADFVGWGKDEFGAIDQVVFVRCAPGGTNTIDPKDPAGGECAPTIDDLRYETVRISASQPDQRGSTGIWIITDWEFEQVDPVDLGQATDLMEAFLQARLDGAGAEQYLRYPDEVPPLLYATASGARFERYELQSVESPDWTGAEPEFKVRLFADRGTTVVEHSFTVSRNDEARLVLSYLRPPDWSNGTTQNGQPVGEPYSFLDGEVTFAALWPWDLSPMGGWVTPTLTTLSNHDLAGGYFAMVADPRLAGTGCEAGTAPADAEELVRILSSDPDLEVSEPVTVNIAGTEALVIEVGIAADGATCDEGAALLFDTEGDLPLATGDRVRLYVLDVPEGSASVLAIAIIGPEEQFEQVLEAATPIVDSVQLHPE
jgi:hypothetical protein